MYSISVWQWLSTLACIISRNSFLPSTFCQSKNFLLLVLRLAHHLPKDVRVHGQVRAPSASVALKHVHFVNRYCTDDQFTHLNS